MKAHIKIEGISIHIDDSEAMDPKLEALIDTMTGAMHDMTKRAAERHAKRQEESAEDKQSE